MRINKTWLKTSYLNQIMTNRLTRYKKDAVNFYQPLYEKYQFNEKGD